MGNIAQLLKGVANYQCAPTQENKDKLKRIAQDVADRTGSKDIVNNLLKKAGVKL
jgi:hypothetical protein